MKYILMLFFSIYIKHGFANELHLRFIGSYQIPTGTLFNGEEFGGISGIEKSEEGHYFAISDERGGEHGNPRLYKISLDYDAKTFKSVTIENSTKMRQANGEPFSGAQATVDPESIRLAPNGNFYWSSEGNFDSNPARLTQPFVREMKPDGTFVREFNTPFMYQYHDNQSNGGRNNKLFEALTVDEHGTLYVANEEALIQDGQTATESNSSVVRVTALDPKTGHAIKQYACTLPSIPIHATSNTLYAAVNGVTEMLSLGNQRFIMIERAFAAGVGQYIRLVESSINPETTDISEFKSLINAQYQPMTRKVLLEIPANYQGMATDNIEGITWGKTLENGHRTLILVSDNNFSKTQVTQFLAFEVLENK